ncbi:uncharacterized protein LOC120638939 [Ornithorhynchus anatinus]|uniref:uncharacterized protein LOC120638939 n=1 Tax=Ornithorhynchus anatinus TaxID=9258 RepID=UPI0019D41A2C|nr:uncharacterized protein LOC120638939 [Ornithorhynchus anatinus]
MAIAVLKSVNEEIRKKLYHYAIPRICLPSCLHYYISLLISSQYEGSFMGPWKSKLDSSSLQASVLYISWPLQLHIQQESHSGNTFTEVALSEELISGKAARPQHPIWWIPSTEQPAAEACPVDEGFSDGPRPGSCSEKAILSRPAQDLKSILLDLEELQRSEEEEEAMFQTFPEPSSLVSLFSCFETSGSKRQTTETGLHRDAKRRRLGGDEIESVVSPYPEPLWETQDLLEYVNRFAQSLAEEDSSSTGKCFGSFRGASVCPIPNSPMHTATVTMWTMPLIFQVCCKEKGPRVFLRYPLSISYRVPCLPYEACCYQLP